MTVRSNGHHNGAGAHDVVLVHSSDLHLGDGARHGDFHGLTQVLAAARAVHADAVLLAGDIFDHNRLPLAVLDTATRLMADAGRQIVILPGNHDCLAANSVYRRGGLAEPDNVHVLGITHEETVPLPHLDLEVWGRAHLDHVDMSPLRDPRPRGAARWNVAAAHGHWVTGAHDHHRSWLIHDEEISSLDVDYVALGHWDRALRVGAEDGPPAYYSGSPDLARTVNVVRFSVDGGVQIERLPLEGLDG